MINDVFAPVVKTLFIPEGNPGVQEVKEIRAVPRVTEANGDAQEITVSGEMDLSISYVPISDLDDEIPWRTIHFSTENQFGQSESEAQVIARLESALKEDQESDEVDEYNGEQRGEECFKIDISVPFTLAIDTDGFRGEHIVKLDPCIHSSNWFVVGPNAIEYEAVLQFASEEEVKEREITREEPTIMEMEDLTEKKNLKLEEPRDEELREEDSPAPEPDEEECAELRAEQVEQSKMQEQIEEKMPEEKEPVAQQELIQQELMQQQEIITQQDAPVQQEPMVMQQMIQQEAQDQNIKQEKPLKLKPQIQQSAKSKAKLEIEKDKQTLIEKGYFQMKFYRVQLGEDLDAIADRFDISRDRISTYNSINEEEIRTGLLLSIPQS